MTRKIPQAMKTEPAGLYYVHPIFSVFGKPALSPGTPPADSPAMIFLSFAGIKENQYDAAICHIGEIMQDLYIKNHLLLESDDDHK